jgi:flagellin-like protein|tara:strand:+ start:398 stop:847 length:450 start_codon:yes stop_codon:yes gene_type:complete
MYKKGVSPLIATILLIGFAVALGAVVMNWGKTIVEETSFTVGDCSRVNINVDENTLCYGDNSIQFTLDNIGDIDLESVVLWVVGDKNSYQIDLPDSNLKRNTQASKKVLYDFNSYGNIVQLQFIPKIKSEDSIIPCTKNSQEKSRLRSC